jgi:uncharacterized repeat protein (TIGR01451 family)
MTKGNLMPAQIHRPLALVASRTRSATQYRFIPLIFLIVLTLFSVSVAQAEVVEIVTYYGKTGGIFGDGKLNIVGNKVNGRDTCPQANTNANGTPGCDMSDDSGYQTVDPNDPTDDIYTGDLIVRTSDLFELYAGWSVNGTSAPITLSSTLPTGKGLAWGQLPSSCKAGSSISADGLTMACVRSGYDKNGIGSYSEDLPFNIKILPSTLNGVQPGSLSMTITGTSATKTDTTENNSITITAAPKWNIQKTGYTVVENQTFNGKTGYIIKYLYYLEADEVTGETETASAVLGNEALGENFTLEFDDNITYLTNSTTNAELVGCKIEYSGGADPYPSYNSTYPDRSVATPLANMTQTCTQTGGAGSTIHLIHTGIDASMMHVPTKTRSGAITPLTRSTIAIGNIEIFVPATDVSNYGTYNNGTDSGYLDTVNTLGSFDPVSISGQSNFGNVSESLKDNARSQRLYYYGPGYMGGTFYKFYMDNINTVVPINTASGWYYGDGVLTPNREFAARIYFYNTGNKAFNNTILCDVIDTNTHDMIDIVGQENIHAAKPYGSLANFSHIIEYATGYAGTWPPPIDNNNAVAVVTECSDPSVVWHATTADARATGEPITKVRVRLTEPFTNTRPSSTYIGLLINLKTRSDDLNGQILPNGTNIVNYSAVHDDVLYATQPNQWVGSSRILHAYPDAPTSDRKADRAVLTRAIVRTQETLNQSVVEPGDTVHVNIHSTFTTDNPDGENNTVKIIEFLDEGLKYVIGSANIGDPSFGSCADLEDGSLKTSCTSNDQILIWDLGTRTSNLPIDDISFDITVGATAASGTIHTYDMISSPSDNSKLAVRTSNRNITVTVPSALLISKEVNTPFRNPDQSPIEFTTFIRNGASKNLTNLDVIDVLPFNGDGLFGVDFTVSTTTINHKRFQATAYTGTYEFLNADGGYSCTSGDNWYYSNTDPRNINLAPTANSNKANGTTTWCQGTKAGPAGSCGFINADVTAVRLTGPALPGDASCSMKVKLKPTGNGKGDIYTNNSGAYANGVSLPVMSNDVSAFVPTTLFGDTIWIDANANGLQDKGEVGVEGIFLELLDENDAVLATTTTDKNGKYKFIDLTADKIYKVRATIKSFYAFSPKNQGSDRTKDSNINPATGTSDTLTLNFNQQNKTIDIGVTSSLTISGKAYKDDNINSTFDAETGIPSVILNLYKDVNKDNKLDTDDILVSSTQTNPNGDYTFSNVFSGDYVIEIDTSKNTPPSHLLNGVNPLPVIVVNQNITEQNYPFIPKVRPYSAQSVCAVAGFSETFRAGIGRFALPASITTSYTYNNGSSATATDNYIQNGQYAVLDKSSIALAGNEWLVGNDVTGDTNGHLLMINADTTVGKYYQQSISGLTVGKTYTYTISIANAASQSNASKPNAKLSIESGGSELHSTTTGVINASSGQFNWYKKELIFTATQTNLELVLTNAALVGNDNNVVIDDITLARSCKDYGDAPTTGTSYGEASHAIAAGLYLGAIPPDADNANQANADANGDDSDGGDDEDAVSNFPKLTDLDIGLPYEVSIKATNLLDISANLIAWIDFDHNGTFDADEASAITSLPARTNNANVKIKWKSVPADIKISDSFARIRLTTNPITANDVTSYVLNGEVEDYPITIEIGGYPVKGRVYNDTNVDGVSNDTNEKGISNLPIVLIDTINNSCISTPTDGNGFYEFFPVIPGDYQLYEASRETVPAPQSCDITKAKDPTLYRSTTANVLGIFSVVDAEITGKDFGDVNTPFFSPDHSSTILAGNTVFYTHTFTPKSSGTVNFTAANSAPITAGWSSLIYQDSDCNSKLDGTEASAPIANNLATSANMNICLINKVYAPNNVANGETYHNVISANFDFNNALAGTVTLKATDLSKTATNDDHNPTKSSKLELRKTVQNITLGTPATETQNQAKPGNILEYAIHYSNTGTGVITDLKINDVIPEFTVLNGMPICQMPLPTSLTNCSATVNNANIEWIFGVNDVLTSGAKGIVSYKVTIE